MRFIISIIFLLFTNKLLASDCYYTLNGQIFNQYNTPLEFVEIKILENQTLIKSDEQGKFVIPNLCIQTYHFEFNHINCQTDTIIIHIKGDRKQTFYLEQLVYFLDEFTKTDAKLSDNLQMTNTINKFSMQQLSGKDLAQAIQAINGIRVIKSGSNINKPMFNGFYGDRITLVNNGVLFQSQDWGTDHAPEIAISNINKIAILNNSQTVEYSTQNIGATITIDNPLISYKDAIKFGLSYGLQSNGWQNSLATYFQKSFKKQYAFRIQTAFKKSADLHTPRYTLSNTAQQETSLSFQQKFNIKKSTIQTIYSLFSNENGILLAAHIGNIEDLKNAINSDTPIIIEPASYKIKNPKQFTQHHLLDIKLVQPLRKHHFIEYRTNFQNNRRQEYDIRRGNRSSTPALNMHLISYYGKLVNHSEKYLKTNWKWHQKSGLIYQYKNNTNDPNTGIIPIIPDYLQYNFALFSIQEFFKNNISFDVGVRYENQQLNSYTFNKKELIIYKKNYNTYNFTANFSYLQKYFDYQTSISLSSKAPNISELFSNGLHHGTATIEYGNKMLKIENSYALSNAFNLKYRKYILLNIDYKLQYLKNFIYLQPNSDFLLTIKGAFPVFQYQSTNAFFNNIKIHTQINITDYFQFQFQSNLIRAKNLKTKDYIVNIPADQLKFGLKFYGDTKVLKNAYLQINGDYILKQKRTPKLIKDYKDVPNAYFLLNLQLGTSVGKANKIMLSFAAENILNKNYRDYLNRFRYFTDEIGFNFLFKINYFLNH